MIQSLQCSCLSHTFFRVMLISVFLSGIYSFMQSISMVSRCRNSLGYTSQFRCSRTQTQHHLQQLDLKMVMADLDPTGNSDADYQKFLAGSEGKPWKGTRIALARRGQIPLPEYSAQDVVRICLAALQNNDDPQLDHGACVSLEFKSPMGPLAEGNLDPAAYGRFIRGSNYVSLIDFKTSELVGELEPLSDSLSVRQHVRITDWQSSPDSRGVSNFDFYLSQVRGSWLLDIILIRK